MTNTDLIVDARGLHAWYGSSHVLHGGRIHIAQQGELVDVHDRTNATLRQRIAGMCDIRDRARKLLAKASTSTVEPPRMVL